MKKLLLLLSVVLLMTACFNGSKEEVVTEKKVFKIGAIPDQNVSVLNRRFGEIAKYISEETGMEVEYVPTVDYSALVTAFEREEINLVWFGGLTGVQARNLVPNSEAIAQRAIDENFQSVFVAQKGLDIKSLEDLKGHSLTFGSESSTSGHLMPRHFMIESNIDLTTDLDGAPNYSGSHDKTWKLVEAGAFQAGALNKAVWEAAVKNNLVDLDKVEMFYETPEYYDYNWTIGDVDKDFGEGTKAKVKSALLSFGGENKEIMELFSDEKFIESKNENYDAIKSVAKELKIID